MPMTERSRTRVTFSAVRFPFKSVVELLLLAALASSATVLCAQTVEVKLVNGRSGRPVADQCIGLWVGNRSKPSSGPLLETQTERNGVTTVRLTNDDTKISTQNQRLACGLMGVINPVVKEGDTISIRAGYALCQPHTPDYSWLVMTDFSTKELLQRGIVTTNTCGKSTASPKPGEVILFVRPLTWWEKLKR
jgi:hypothetical protein